MGKTTTTKRVAVVDAYPQDGDVYALPSGAEWPGQTTSDTYVIAETADGTRYLHSSFRVQGWHQGEEFVGVTSRSYCEQKADAFIAKVLAQGSIDPALWEKLPPPSDRPAPTYWDEDERAAGRHLGYASLGVL